MIEQGFVMYGFMLDYYDDDTDAKIVDNAVKKYGLSDETEFAYLESEAEFPDKIDIYEGTSPEYLKFFVGVCMSEIKDDETGAEFKKRVRDLLTEIFDLEEDDVEFGIITDAWM